MVYVSSVTVCLQLHNTVEIIIQMQLHREHVYHFHLNVFT